MACIEANGLRKAYGDVEAVRGISFSVVAGEVFCLLGPNGAGKTTTTEILEGYRARSAGEVRVLGHDPEDGERALRERVGIVLQEAAAQAELTVAEVLTMYGRYYPRRRPAGELVELVGLGGKESQRVKLLSGGQRRRLDLAMGMAHRPRLLLLDEPTAGLDPHSRVWLWDEIRRLRDAGTTVFVNTHYLEEADALCDRLAIIDGGRIISTGTPEELKRQLGGEVVWLGLQADGGRRSQAIELLHCQPGVRALRDADDGLQLTVERGEEALPRLLRLLDGAGMPIRTATLARPTLDDVFLRLTGRSLRERETELT
jgi:ABC-2 type transport system ATP-binding protein